MFVSVLAMTGIRIGCVCVCMHLCVCVGGVLSKILEKFSSRSNFFKRMVLFFSSYSFFHSNKM